MKRKLYGLLSLWLAVLMFLTSLTAFAESEALTIFLYKGTEPIEYGDYVDLSDESLVSEGIFEEIPDFKDDEAIDAQLKDLDKLPEAPDGSKLGGWILWTRGSGMIDPIEYEGADAKLSDTEYFSAKYLEPVWTEILYEITKQPTVEDPSVEVNIPDDVKAYQWYALESFPEEGDELDLSNPLDEQTEAELTEPENGVYFCEITFDDETKLYSDIIEIETVAAPEFTPGGKTFTSRYIEVRLSCETPDAIIYYTTDGSDPVEDGIEYDDEITIRKTTTIKAYAVKEGMKDSEVVSERYKKRSSSGGSSGGGGVSIKTYTVTFDSNGGMPVDSQYVRSNNVVTKPKAPTKGSLTFDGWYTDEALTKEYDFTTPVSKSFTLYAKWSDEGDSSGMAANNRIILTIGQHKMLVFGKETIMDVVPHIVDNRTVLPARHVAEAIGAYVHWDEAEPEKVRITKDSTEIIIYIGSDTAYVNGEAVTLDCTAFLESDRTFVPVRFICENLGATVDWEEGEQQVIIIVK